MHISNAYRLCQILVVLPASSVDCERGFSNLNRIKRDDRNKIDGDHLVSLMRISSFDLEELEFDKLHLPELIKLWKTEKERRTDGKVDLNLN